MFISLLVGNSPIRVVTCPLGSPLWPQICNDPTSTFNLMAEESGAQRETVTHLRSPSPSVAGLGPVHFSFLEFSLFKC